MEIKNDTVSSIKLKNFDSDKAKSKAEIGKKELELLYDKDSPITSFKKVPGKNDITCSLEDGTTRVIPVDESLQLFYDKMEMHPEVEVDFGKQKKDRVEILPFQNKIAYINGETGEVIKSLPLKGNLIYQKTDSITGAHVQFDSRLNPAVLAVLADNLSAQNDYAKGTGNIDIIYNFDEKSEKKLENMSNKSLAKTMNNYYKSEKEYAEELRLNNLQKVGYVDIFDKIQTSIQEKKQSKQEKRLYAPEDVSSFEQARKEFSKELQNFQTSTIVPTQDTQKENIEKVSNPAVPNNAAMEK